MDRKSILLARVAIWSTVFFFLIMFVAFVFIQPELNPLYRFGSEYAVGRMGWLMKLSFFVWGTGLVAFALAMAYGLDPAAKSPTAIALFVLAGAGIVLGGIFDSDLQVPNETPPPRWVEPPASDEHLVHAVVGLIAFCSLMPAAGLASRRLRTAGRLSGGYRWLRALSWLLPVAFVALAAVFIPQGFAGLGQRIFLVLVFAWIIIAAIGLTTRAFVAHPRAT